MRIRVRFFARARDLAGAESRTLELSPGATTDDLRQRLVQDHPNLASFLERCALAIDDVFVQDARPLHDGAEAAILPPVSGGAPSWCN